MRCAECKIKFPDKNCIECKELIDGAFLAKKTVKELHIKLKSISGSNDYDGVVKLISPVGVALKSNVPVGEYIIRLLEDLEIKVSLVKARGKPPYQGFDILYVRRNNTESTRLSSEDFGILSKTKEEIIDELTDDLPSITKDLVREKLKEDIERSRLLDSFKIGKVLKYQSGRIKSLSSEGSDISLSEKFLKEFMEKSFKERSYIRDKVIGEEGEKVYDLHALPTDHKSGGLISIDVTDIILAERKNREKELKIYRDVIEAVTGGKLILLNENEIIEVIEKGKKIVEREVNEPKNLQEIRKNIRYILEKLNFNPTEGMHILLCVSEATTNALKHANGGSIIVKIYDDHLNIIVSDNGDGIDFTNLPKASLMKSYSDSGTFSLGNGFTLMLRFIDQLYLKTNSSGTTLILRKKIS